MPSQSSHLVMLEGLSDLSDVKVIHFAVKLSLVGEQLVLWHQRDLMCIEFQVSGACKVDALKLPTLIFTVVETWMRGGITDFNEHFMILKSHIDQVPRGTQMREWLTSNIWLHLLQCGVCLLKWKEVQVFYFEASSIRADEESRTLDPCFTKALLYH